MLLRRFFLEIVTGRLVQGEISLSTNIPVFVSVMIQTGLQAAKRCSFQGIFEIPKKKRLPDRS
jgi:hypothetical protein